MNKFSIYGLAALCAVSFVACDDYEEPNPQPQTNPQESILKTDDVTVANALSSEAYDLSALNKKGELINLATVKVENLPSGYGIAADMQISQNNFSNAYAVPATIEQDENGDFKVMVDPAALEDVYYTNITKDPAQTAVDARILVKTVTGTLDSSGNWDKIQYAYVGGPTNYYGPYTLNMLPYPPETIIDSKFYLLNNDSNWSTSQALEFAHTAASQYDDPNFKITFEVSKAQAAQGYFWKIAGASVLDTQSEWLGVSETGDPQDKAGTLVAGGAAGEIYESGTYMLSINVEDLSYTISLAYEQLYVQGTGYGWDWSNPIVINNYLATNDYVTYTGYEYLDTEFKFTSALNWDEGNFGAGSEPGTIANGSNDNCKVPAETGTGLYWVSVNMDELTYAITFINNIGLVGTLNGWSEVNNIELTPNENYLIWTGDITFDEGGEWKFNMNKGWDINLGGSMTDLVQGGDNIASPGAGEYTVTLDLTKRPYSCSVVKK